MMTAPQKPWLRDLRALGAGLTVGVSLMVVKLGASSAWTGAVSAWSDLRASRLHAAVVPAAVAPGGVTGAQENSESLVDLRIALRCQRNSWNLRASPPACPFERATILSLPWALANGPSMVIDSWGNPVWLTCQMHTGQWRISALSAGPDGELDTDDDQLVLCGALDYALMQ